MPPDHKSPQPLEESESNLASDDVSVREAGLEWVLPPGQAALGSVAVKRPVAVPSQLRLYVPHPESRLCTELAHSSAIVGLPMGSGEVLIHYEGNLRDALDSSRYHKIIREHLDANPVLPLQEQIRQPRGQDSRPTDQDQAAFLPTIEPATGLIEIDAQSGDLRWWIDRADLEDLGL